MKVWSWRSAITKSGLPAQSKLLLLTLAVYMNEHGESCFPTLDDLVRDTSLARATVVKYLDVAEEAGFIRRKKHGYKGQNWANNEYIATYPKGVELGQPQDIAEGSSPDELPVPEEKGSSPDEPPSGGRQFTPEQKVVHPVNSNSPYNSPLPKRRRRRETLRACARDDDELIKIFDEERIGIFGARFARGQPRHDDAKYAAQFREAGATSEFFRAQCREAMRLRRAAGKDAPTGLVYFAGMIPEALAQVRASVDRSPPLPLEITPEALGGDTPDNRGLADVLRMLQAKHGEAIFRSWLAPLRIRHRNCASLRLTLPTRFMAEWVKTHYGGDIETAARPVWPGITDIIIEAKL